MAFDDDLKQNTDQPLTYQIKLKGYLDVQWADWFENTTIQFDKDGNTLLTCVVPDQAALHGLLKKIRDIGLFLISLHYVELDSKEE
jgi:hypothetical protein